MADNKSPLRQTVEIYRDAARAGVQSLKQLLGAPTDPAVAQYRRMTAEDFKGMVQEYGQPEVERYIRHMELKSQQGR